MKIKLALALLSLITASLGYFGYSRLTNQAVSINEVSGPTDAYVALLLEPGFDIKPANIASKIGLSIDTGPDIRIKRVNIELTYTEDKCLRPKVELADFLSRTVAKPEINKGTIKFIVASPANSSVNGNGQLAYITTGPTKGDCQIKFTENTRVIEADTDANILGSVTDSYLKLKTSNPNLPTFKQPGYRPDTLTR